MRTPRQAPRIALAAGLLAGMALAPNTARPARAADEAPASLARYVPSADLVGYVEFDGLDAHAEAWKKSAAYKVLNETSLGATVEDMIKQLVAAPKVPSPVKLSGDEMITLAKHLFRSGFVVAISAPKQEEGRPHSDPRVVVVVRDGARKDVRAIFAKVMGSGGGQRKIVAKGKRNLINVTDASGESWNWWPEKDDLVVSGPPADYADVVLETLDGKRPNAVDHPIRVALAKEADGFLPIGLGFTDMAKIPLPPEAAKAGLDGLKQVDFRWGFQDDALMSVIHLAAPSPRKGVLALFDQPTFGIKDLPPLPAGLKTFTVFSFDPDKLYGAISEVAKTLDPRSGMVAEKAESAVKETTKLRLREDLLSQIGPKMAFFAQKPAKGSAPVNIPGVPVAIEVPEVVLSIQVADGAKFAKTLDKLMTTVNKKLKDMGGPPGAQPAGGAAAPGSGGKPPAIEFKKAPGRGPGATYTLTPPAGALPPGVPAELKPTVAVGKTTLVLATTPAAAQAVLKLEAASTARWKADGDFAALAAKLPAKMTLLTVGDPRETVPAIVTNLPAMIQAANAQIQARAGMPGGGGIPGATGIPIKVDASKLPKAEELASRLFPSSFAVGVDDEGLRMISREPLPSVTSPATVGVMAALLLPATQGAREAARRAQCTNNLKQIGLAMHNHHDAMGKFPAAAIMSKDGKPLLSWRVAILPFIEQKPLYDKFKLDEPWDSENNKKLIEEMPKIYACPSHANPAPSATNYQAIVGKGAAFEGNDGLRINDFTDGTSNTLLVAESNEAVPWTKPEDLPIDEDAQRPTAKPGSRHTGGFNALLTDGSVRFIKLTIDPKTLRALMTRAAGEVIDAGSF